MSQPQLVRSTSRYRSHVRRGARLHTLLAVTGLAAAAAASGCGTALLSVGRQLPVILESQETALGVQAFEQSLAGLPMSHDEQTIALVNRVGQRIAAAADKPEYDWEFRVLAKEEPLAFALPGGKVAVSEGMLAACEDEAGVAAVISHEVAHTLARHGGERLSRPSADAGRMGVIGASDRGRLDGPTPQEIMQVYGAAPNPGSTLPYSRKHEAEADAIGLILMAKAGYDPSAYPEFWERLSRQTGNRRPAWRSLHAADGRRITSLRSMLPVAMNYYNAAPNQLGLGEPLPNSGRAPHVPATASAIPPAVFPAHAKQTGTSADFIVTGDSSTNRAGETSHTASDEQIASDGQAGSGEQSASDEPAVWTRSRKPLVSGLTSRTTRPITPSTHSGSAQSFDVPQEVDTEGPSDWERIAELPLTLEQPAGNDKASLRRVPPATSVSMSSEEPAGSRDELPKPRSTEADREPVIAANSIPVDDETFYPPIAASHLPGRTTDAYQPPGRSIETFDDNWDSEFWQ